MFCLTVECKEAGMLCPAPTLRLRSSYPQHLAGESFRAQGEKSFLPLCGWRKRNLRSNNTIALQQGSNKIESIFNCNTGQERRHPGFCYHYCFQGLCTGQVHTQSWLVSSALLHEHALSSKRRVSVPHLPHSDTLCQCGNPQWRKRAGERLTLKAWHCQHCWRRRTRVCFPQADLEN